MAKDYYQVLGVSRTASEADIKTAFRKLAQKFHPDKKGGDEAKFKEISEAYAVLSDKQKRAQYDAVGRGFGGGTGPGPGFSGFDFSGFQNAGGFGFNQGNVEFDLGDIFGDLFGGAAGARAPRGRDISIDIELPFKEAIFGTERRVLVSKLSTCEVCSGSGAKPSTKMMQCSSCAGKGQIRETRNTFFGTFTTARVCPTCKGRGEAPQEQCNACRGAGVTKRQEEMHIVVPAGVDDGEMIRMPGQGEASVGASAGDMYVKLHVRPDSRFERVGHNLQTKLPIKLSDALLGASYTLESLDGSETVGVPPGVAHGAMIRLRGKGVPSVRGQRGDLLVRIEISMPKRLSRAAQTLIEQLRKEGL